MFSKKERYIIRDKTYRSIFIKNKFKNKLRRSMLKNNTLIQTKKILLKVNFNENPSKLRKKNICLLSGENNTIQKRFLVSRFALNSLSISNKLQNFKINA
jgi:hypothetical protein